MRLLLRIAAPSRLTVKVTGPWSASTDDHASEIQLSPTLVAWIVGFVGGVVSAGVVKVTKGLF